MNYNPMQLRISDALNEKTDSVVRKSGLSKAEVLRFALEIGIDAMLRSDKAPPQCYMEYIRKNNPGLK